MARMTATTCPDPPLTANLATNEIASEPSGLFEAVAQHDIVRVGAIANGSVANQRRHAENVKKPDDTLDTGNAPLPRHGQVDSELAMPASPSTEVGCSRKSMSRPGVRADRANEGVAEHTKTTLLASRYGSGLNSAELMTLKIAVFRRCPRPAQARQSSTPDS